MSDFLTSALYVVRHGECEHNVQHLVAAQNDSPLTVRGHEQARVNGVLLKDLGAPLHTMGYYASPLHRAAMTMEIMRIAAGLPLHGYTADRRLMEIDCGSNTWRTWPDIEADASQDPIWKTDPWSYVHPGGESLAMLFDRVGDFLRSLRGESVLVAHAGTMRMIRAHVLGLSKTATMEYHPPNTGILRLAGGSETYFGE
ncbi:MAG: histidine phosphatase family protein [Rhizomicrobium sp.]|jgi:probable phosphoglycerate mutase